MSDQNPGSAPQDDAGTVKDPQEWTTGDEPATGAQLSYLGTLSREAGRELPDNLTKAQASSLIDELQGQSGRVADDGDRR